MMTRAEVQYLNAKYRQAIQLREYTAAGRQLNVAKRAAGKRVADALDRRIEAYGIHTLETTAAEQMALYDHLDGRAPLRFEYQPNHGCEFGWYRDCPLRIRDGDYSGPESDSSVDWSQVYP